MEQKLKPFFFLSLFALVIGLNIYLFSSLFHTLAFATIIAGSFYPLFNFIHHRKKVRKNIAALLTTACILLTVILPTIYLIAQISKETLEIYQNISKDFNREVIKDQFVGEGIIATTIEKGINTLQLDLTKEEFYQQLITRARGYLGSALQILNGLVGNALNLLFQFILLLIASYALFLSGDRLKEYFFKLSPLPDDQEQKILDRYNQMNYVTLVGNGIGGVIQGVLAGIAFWLAGIPSVFLWTTVMVILAFVPLVGMSIVFIPASIYLLIIGKTFWGVFVLVWCGVVSLIVENVYKPKFVGDRVQVNGIVLLFYIIAGMSVFGTPGLFYGPILCIFFLTVSEIFTSYYLSE